jgi:hypothetical protein
MEGSCSTGQSPQWAVVPMEKEECRSSSGQLYMNYIRGQIIIDRRESIVCGRAYRYTLLGLSFGVNAFTGL